MFWAFIHTSSLGNGLATVFIFKISVPNVLANFMFTLIQAKARAIEVEGTLIEKMLP